MAFGSKENKTPVQVPAHIGIIMDGNGRWAKKRGLPRTAGHTAAERFTVSSKSIFISTSLAILFPAKSKLTTTM